MPTLPARAKQIGELLPIPRHLEGAPVERQHVQRDDCVVGAGRRVAYGPGDGRGVGGVRDVPDADGPAVHPRGQDRRAVGCPPDAAEPLHLFSGDELGHAPGHVGVIVACQQPVRPPRAGDAQGSLRDVGDAFAGGIDLGLEHRPAGPQLGAFAGFDVGQVESAAQGEGRAMKPVVDRVRHDALAALAGAFPPGTLLGRQLLSRVAEDRGGVAHQTLAAAVEVEGPQARAWVVAGAAAQERDAGAVTGHGEAARCSVRETGRDRLLAGERERFVVGAGDHRAADSSRGDGTVVTPISGTLDTACRPPSRRPAGTPFGCRSRSHPRSSNAISIARTATSPER